MRGGACKACFACALVMLIALSKHFGNDVFDSQVKSSMVMLLLVSKLLVLSISSSFLKTWSMFIFCDMK